MAVARATSHCAVTPVPPGGVRHRHVSLAAGWHAALSCRTCIRGTITSASRRRINGGLSPASNEVLAPDARRAAAAPRRRPAASPAVFGRYVQSELAVSARRRRLSAELHRYARPGVPFPGANLTAVTAPGAPLGVYQATLTTASRAARRSVGPEAALTIDGAPPPGPRTPNPPAGSACRCPTASSVVNAVAARFPT